MTRRSRTSATGGDILAKIRMLIHEVDGQKIDPSGEALYTAHDSTRELFCRIIMNLII
ncbi:MAG: hypothetical protein ACLP9D_14675 [Candidatus Bathyarchaeia archaeon]